MEERPFIFLSVDLPAPPLFRDETKESIIPQVPLMQILSKFDGITEQEYKTYKENYLKRYEITKLPKYLIMCFRVKFQYFRFFDNLLNISNLSNKAIYQKHFLLREKSNYCKFSSQV